MSDQQDLTAATEAAWVGFRGRLADHVAEMVDDDVLIVAYADRVADDGRGADGADGDEGAAGSAPYVQLCAFGDGWVQVEAVSNAYLAEAAALVPEQEAQLVDLGWQAPTDEPGEGNFHDTVTQREADRVAVLMVRTLREVYGVPHPAFLLAEGLEVDHGAGAAGTWADEPEAPGTEGDGVAFPRGPEHLQDLVDEAMREVFPDLQHDGDGDIPIIAGRSVVFVRVVAARPAVEIYAEIVLDPEDEARVPLELELLNKAQPLWKFVRHDARVVMRHELVALPFVGHLLRTVVHRFVEEVDAIAADLAARVGGHRFAEVVEPVAAGDSVLQADSADLAMVGLLELCHLGRPRAATVAGLFDHDRAAIIRQIIRVRTGRQTCDGHQVDDVLTALRKALRLVSEGEPRPGPVPPTSARSMQQSLLSSDDLDEETLDLGWTA